MAKTKAASYVPRDYDDLGDDIGSALDADVNLNAQATVRESNEVLPGDVNYPGSVAFQARALFDKHRYTAAGKYLFESIEKLGFGRGRG